MCTSVPQTPAHRTRMSTSSSRILGSGTSLSLNPGPAVSFTSAFTRDSSCVESGDRAAGEGAASGLKLARLVERRQGNGKAGERKEDRVQNTDFRIQPKPSRSLRLARGDGC